MYRHHSRGCSCLHSMSSASSTLAESVVGGKAFAPLIKGRPAVCLGMLPPETLLDVPYAELVADQERWTRRILEFLGLPWDERCLDFHSTVRPVTTASTWQVRQKIYKGSVERWRNYEKFIGPLRGLKDPT